MIAVVARKTEISRHRFLLVLVAHVTANQQQLPMPDISIPNPPFAPTSTCAILHEVRVSNRSIPSIKVQQVKDLNCLDLLSFKYLIMPKDAIKVIKETFA